MWGRPYLACLRTIWVKLDLLRSKFTSCVHIIAQIDPAKGTLTQELPPTPIDGSTRSYREQHERALDHELSVRGASCPTGNIRTSTTHPFLVLQPHGLGQQDLKDSSGKQGTGKMAFCVDQITLFSKLLNILFISSLFLRQGLGVYHMLAMNYYETQAGLKHSTILPQLPEC